MLQSNPYGRIHEQKDQKDDQVLIQPSEIKKKKSQKIVQHKVSQQFQLKAES